MLEGINNLGHVVGQADDPVTGELIAFVFDGTFRKIVFPPSFFPGSDPFIAHDINDDGEIVGTFEDTSGRRRGYLFDGVNFSLFDAPTTRGTSPLGMNHSRHIVGQFDSPEYSFDNKGFFYDGTSFTAFPNIFIASGISNNDLIAGTFEDEFGRRHGVVGDADSLAAFPAPVPEPSTLALMATGLGGIGCAGRRKS